MVEEASNALPPSEPAQRKHSDRTDDRDLRRTLPSREAGSFSGLLSDLQSWEVAPHTVFRCQATNELPLRHNGYKNPIRCIGAMVAKPAA